MKPLQLASAAVATADMSSYVLLKLMFCLAANRSGFLHLATPQLPGVEGGESHRTEMSCFQLRDWQVLITLWH